MKKTLILSIAVVGLLVTAIAPAIAQRGNNDMLMARLETELEVTDGIIQQARDAVHTSNNPLGAVNLKQAEELQDQARQLQQRLRGQFRIEWHGQAMTATQKARELARAAMANSRYTEQYEGAVQQHLERAEEMLQRAREALGASDNPNLEAVYRSAEDRLAQAWEFYRTQQYRPAYKLANQVEKAARKIIESATDVTQARNTYERKREQVFQLMQQTREQVSQCGSQKAEHELNQAQQAYQRAIDLHADDNVLPALNQLRISRELALKAAQECQGQGYLEQLYERLKQDADRLSEANRDLSGPEADKNRELLQQAYRQLELAREHIANQQVEAATASLKAVQLTLRQVNRRQTQDE
ncbi:MAG: hypothetical protein PVH24_05440 [Candidatus Zixiibacteriota bacterium]|jgi:hypothetical protein